LSAIAARLCLRTGRLASVTTLTKRRADAPAQFFEAEAAGLRWLASAGGAKVVQVARVEPGLIELEQVPEVRSSAQAALAFGAALARTHDAGAAAFGAPPDGWAGPMFIGRRELPAGTDASWGAFYARDRVLPYLDPALKAWNLTGEQEVVVRDACDLVASGVFDDAEPPARLHGDLWAGNVLWGAEGVVLIDPAAHGGHRETDLAMLELFGCDFLERILEGYESVHPLRDGWRERIPVHQLHPLAVHAAGHGPQYGAALAMAARRTLELA
jgi:fructosamine-3-kinase